MDEAIENAYRLGDTRTSARLATRGTRNRAQGIHRRPTCRMTGLARW